MSIVWRAFDEVRQMQVAAKLVPQNLAPAFDSETLARLIGVSRHPGIVTLIEHGWQDQWWYQIAEWLDGDTLASLCRSQPISFARSGHLKTWMKQLAGALEAQHSAGFIHGDVKPSNVLVTSGQARLIDLPGLRVGDSWARHGRLTPAFASPEACRGDRADPRDDVYSLAAMIGKLLTGKHVSPERASNGLAPPPAGITASQWEVLLGVLDSNRESRVGSTVQLVDAMWPVSAFPMRKPSPGLRRTSIPSVPAFAGQPGKMRRRRRFQEWRVAGKAGLTAALAALVVVGIGTEHVGWRGSAVPAAVSEPIGEQAPPLPRLERVGTRHNAVAVEAAFEAVVGRTSMNVARGSSELMARPAIANRVVASAGVAGRAATPAVLQRTEPAGTAGRPQDNVLPDRPHASALADRAEVQYLPARRQVPREKIDSVNGRAAAIPAVAYLAGTHMPARAQPAAATRLEASAVSDRSETRAAPDRPEASRVSMAALDRPEKPERPEKIERPEKPERPDKLDRPEKPERPERLERPDKPEKPERPEKIERPEKPERPDKLDRPEKPERPEPIARPEKPERPEKPDRPERPDRPEKPERPDKPDKPDRPERPEIPQRPN